MLNILVRQEECCKVDNAKAEYLADKELEGLNDYMEYPIDNLKERGRIELVRNKASYNGSLLKRKDKAVITDDGSRVQVPYAPPKIKTFCNIRTVRYAKLVAERFIFVCFGKTSRNLISSVPGVRRRTYLCPGTFSRQRSSEHS